MKDDGSWYDMLLKRFSKVDELLNLSVRTDLHDLPVVRPNDVEPTVNRNHAVECLVRLEVRWIYDRGGMAQ